MVSPQNSDDIKFLRKKFKNRIDHLDLSNAEKAKILNILDQAMAQAFHVGVKAHEVAKREYDLDCWD